MTNTTNDNLDTSGDFITKQFVAGEWRGGSGEDRAITSPSSGAVLATVPDAGIAELDAAVEQARLAQPGWYDAGPLIRANALREAARRLREQADFWHGSMRWIAAIRSRACILMSCWRPRLLNILPA